MHWYALHVRSNSEKLVEAGLAEYVETFYPSREAKVQIGQHTRIVRKNWFPGYVFVRADWSDIRQRVRILRIPYLVGVLGRSNGEQPAVIQDTEIEALRILANSVLAVTPHPFLRAGDRVRVVKGPLSGAEGFFVRRKHGPRLIVSVDLLGQSVSAEVDAETIEPMNCKAA